MASGWERRGTASSSREGGCTCEPDSQVELFVLQSKEHALQLVKTYGHPRCPTVYKTAYRYERFVGAATEAGKSALAFLGRRAKI